METETANAMQWLQLIVTAVGLITLFIKIGAKQGEQEEKNKKYEAQGQKIEKIESDISEIKSDVSFIKGNLKGGKLL